MKPERIKIRILTTFGGALAGLLVVSIACIFILLLQDMHRNVEARIDSFQELFQNELEKETELCQALLDRIENQPSLQRNWLVLDREELFRQASPFFEEMRSLYRITHVYFMDLDGVCFLRVHQKERYGDTIKRVTMESAIRDGKTVHGIEMGPLGTFTLRVVRPWRIDGKLVGYLEIGEEIGHLVPEMKKILNAEFIFFIHKIQIERSGWVKGMEMLGRKADWDQFTEYVIIYNTIDSIPLSVNKALKGHEIYENEKFHFRMSLDNREYLCGFIPLMDEKKREIGETIMMCDVTDVRASMWRFVIIIIGIYAIVSAAAFGFFYFYFNRIENRLVKTDNILRSEIEERKRVEKIQKVLYNISNAIITADNLEKLISLTQKELGTIIDTSNFYIALFDNKTDTLTLPFFTDEKDKFTSFPAGKSLTYYVIKTQKALLANKERIMELVKSGDIEIFGTVSEIWLGVPLKIEGKVTGVVAVQSYTDENAYTESDMEMLEFISEQISMSIDRKKTEEELQQSNQQLLERNDDLDAFSQTVAHDLKNPLGLVIGYSDLLMDDDDKLSDDETQTYINEINKTGSKMQSIIDELLLLASLRQEEIKSSILDMGDIVEEAIIRLKSIIQKKNATLSVPDSWLRSCGYHAWVEEVWVNYLSNAIKYGGESPWIELGSDTGKSKTVPEGFVRFWVRDHGPGISAENQKRLFSVFERLDQVKLEGHGLGLSIVRRIIEKLGGQVGVESNKQGTLFYFTLPENK